MRLVALYTTSIICGFCMMALEMLGGRYVQNFFGSSIDVWAAIISVFILSLSIGYVIGGRIADQAKTIRMTTLESDAKMLELQSATLKGAQAAAFADTIKQWRDTAKR